MVPLMFIRAYAPCASSKGNLYHKGVYNLPARIHCSYHQDLLWVAMVSLQHPGRGVITENSLAWRMLGKLPDPCSWCPMLTLLAGQVLSAVQVPGVHSDKYCSMLQQSCSNFIMHKNYSENLVEIYVDWFNSQRFWFWGFRRGIF